MPGEVPGLGGGGGGEGRGGVGAGQEGLVVPGWGGGGGRSRPAKCLEEDGLGCLVGEATGVLAGLTLTLLKA